MHTVRTAANPCLLGDWNWGGGTFARSHNPTRFRNSFVALTAYYLDNTKN